MFLFLLFFILLLDGILHNMHKLSHLCKMLVDLFKTMILPLAKFHIVL